MHFSLAAAFLYGMTPPYMEGECFDYYFGVRNFFSVKVIENDWIEGRSNLELKITHLDKKHRWKMWVKFEDIRATYTYPRKCGD